MKVRLMSPDQGQVQRPLDDSNTVFHHFPELAAEIRLKIWDLARPGIIDVYCDEDGVPQVKPHPFLSACPESRSVYLHGASYLRDTGCSRDAKLANIPFHFDQDHFRLHAPSPSISLRQLLDHSTKIVLPPDSFENSKWLSPRYPKKMDIRVCLADFTNHLILTPASAFGDSSPADVYKKMLDTYNNAQEEMVQGMVSMLQGQVLSPPSRSLVEMIRAGAYRDLRKDLEAWDLMLDKELPHMPTVEEIRKARLPMLVYVPLPPGVLSIMGGVITS
ncbi:uncharacterized protein FSUBG_6171 [Fusarium subglutinans]|uniref:2EXR domain-containing protein n=1 Tax=Gibberella subglutinans TaxID=42677 RepID=A0A8H5Q1K2_GIBSU|nr:uncharacterized protein FSUBG_6171 [Fusarium subglutinans]KAF5606337.1 hypothetical protein FSUBG_6171 [Fusarium subglutinans]